MRSYYPDNPISLANVAVLPLTFSEDTGRLRNGQRQLERTSNLSSTRINF